LIRDAPDTLILSDIRPAGYPANLKAGYRISGRLSGAGRILDLFIFCYVNAATCSRRHFLKKFYELIWLSLQFGRISGYFQYPVSGRISGKVNLVSGRIAKRPNYSAGYPEQP
jgi:hypothetical protein